MTDLSHVIEEARTKQIEVLTGAPQTEQELDALAAELGVKFPADYRRLATRVGALSFRKDGVHYFAFGKPGPATTEAGIPLDLRTAGRAFRDRPPPFSDDTSPIVVVPVAAKIDLDHGHVELTLVDADGAYRSMFEGGAISGPRSLLDVEAIFPFFVAMFNPDGTRRSADDLLADMGVTILGR
jgi:hypothetical protein